MKGVTKRKSKAHRKTRCSNKHINIFSERTVPTRKVKCTTKGCDEKVIIPTRLS